ncbi:hypothetical protein H6G93_08620 [Nostoc sp. FACHB-973]|nr:hypothetical protein [Nostoc sp. FACHB-973]
MSELEDKLIEFVKTKVNRLWLNYHDKLSEAPKALQDFFEEVPELFKNIELDNDLRNRREIYLQIAKFIQKKFNQSLPICLGVTHLLCRESDKRLLKDGALGEKRLAEDVKSILLTIKVSYKPVDSQAYNRQLEIYYVNNDQPTAFKLEERLDWDYLPQDVREIRLRQGAETEVFKLYPPKEK